jgi:hypothetical protein
MIVSNLTEIFCDVDDFCLELSKRISQYQCLPSGKRHKRKCRLKLSEVMTIVICFHLSRYRTFKDYYQHCVTKHMKKDFKDSVSYNRFVELMQQATIPLFFYAQQKCLGKATGLSFIDSTTIDVCHNRRIYSHKVFQGIAQKGKSSTGWFFGFKLHLVVNEKGELLGFNLTAGNIDDRNPMVIDKITKNIFGKLFGDRGYLSQALFEKLWNRGIQLITKIKKNMKNKLMPYLDKILLRKRAVIESINDVLKNVCQIEHSRHRSPINFLTNMFSGLVAYTFLPKKPSLKFVQFEQIPVSI